MLSDAKHLILTTNAGSLKSSSFAEQPGVGQAVYDTIASVAGLTDQ